MKSLVIYAININNNVAPFILVIVFFFPIKLNNHINTVESSNNIKLLLNSFEYLSEVIIAPTPNIRNKFNTHDPTKFPTAKSESFFTTANIDVINSGSAVPIATIVSPIILSLTLSVCAILVA